MDLNIPETRQGLLQARLAGGGQIVAAEVAEEFGVSVDTVRRDIIALAEAGKARRVRGGAVPLATPDDPIAMKLAQGQGPSAALVAAGLGALAGARTLLLDGGSTVLGLARALPPTPGLVVMTPSPWLAVAAAERGIEVHLVGGRLSARGGIAVGGGALAEAGALAADIAVLGACGLDAAFGLSSDDYEEARMKQAMAASAAKVLVLTGADKIDKRARHRTLALAQLDRLVTDAPPARTAALAARGLQVTHA